MQDFKVCFNFSLPRRRKDTENGFCSGPEMFSWIVLKRDQSRCVFFGILLPPPNVPGNCRLDIWAWKKGKNCRTVNIMFYYEGHKRFQRNHKSFLLGGDGDMTLKSCFIPAHKERGLLFNPLDFKSTRNVYVSKLVGGYQQLCSSGLMHLKAEVLDAESASVTPAVRGQVCLRVCLSSPCVGQLWGMRCLSWPD